MVHGQLEREKFPTPESEAGDDNDSSMSTVTQETPGGADAEHHWQRGHGQRPLRRAVWNHRASATEAVTEGSVAVYVCHLYGDYDIRAKVRVTMTHNPCLC